MAKSALSSIDNIYVTVPVCLHEAVPMAVLSGGFCLSCVLFAKPFLKNLGQFVTSMTNFTRAKVTLIEHNKQSCISVVFKN